MPLASAAVAVIFGLVETHRIRRLAGAERPSLEQVGTWVGWVVDDVNGSRIGRLESVLPDSENSRADWLVVNEFRFARRRAFVVPALDAVGTRGRVWVPYPRDLVRASIVLAGVDDDGGAALRGHYGLGSRMRAA